MPSNHHPSPKRPTQLDVAKASGYSRPTVSLALKGDPIVCKSTRDQIRRIADSIGYAPDQLLCALSKYHSKKVPQSHQATLAWVSSSPQNHPWNSITPYHQYFLGACERAERLGYTIDTIDLQEQQLSPQRLDGILKARGINGLLICPPVHAVGQYELHWERYSLITFGYALTSPSLHRVSSSHYLATKCVYNKLREAGHERIGFIFSGEVNLKTQELCSSAYLCEEYKTNSKLIPPLIKDPITPADCKAWFERHRPDAAIVSAPNWQTVQASGIRIPSELSVACPTLAAHASELTGILEKSREIGAAAIDTLVHMIQHDIRGIPEDPKYILLEGEWNPGTTMRVGK